MDSSSENSERPSKKRVIKKVHYNEDRYKFLGSDISEEDEEDTNTKHKTN